MLGNRCGRLSHWERRWHHRFSRLKPWRCNFLLSAPVGGCGYCVCCRGRRGLGLGNNLRLTRSRRASRLRLRREYGLRSDLGLRLGSCHSGSAIDSFGFRLGGSRARGATPRRRYDLDCFLNGQEIFLQLDATSSGMHRVALRHRRWGIASCEDHSVLLRIAGSARTLRHVWGSATQRPALQNVRV
jgi:hypothetical protein